MNKKFSIHLDAVVCICLIVIGLLAFLAYQRMQYQSLLEEHVQTQWELQDAQVNVAYFKGLYSNCRNIAE